MKQTRIAIGMLLIIASVIAWVDFDLIGRLFYFLSPDGSITDYMLLLLRLLLLSLGFVGLFLVFYEAAFRFFGRVDLRLVALDEKSLLRSLLLVGFALRLAVFLFMPIHLWGDYGSYDDLARQWIARGGYYNGEYLTGYWPPLYPFFLSRLYLVFGEHASVGAFANIFLGLCIPLLTYFIVKRIWPERVARWTMLIIVFFPSQIFFTRLLASEMVFVPLLLLSILLLVRYAREVKARWYLLLAGGVILGLATLTRSISKLFLAVLAPFWLMETRCLRKAALITLLAGAGSILVIMPWMIRNYHAVGVASINTNTGINLFIGNQPTSGIGYNSSLADQYDVNDPTQEAYIDSVARRRAIDYILEEPLAFVKRGVLKVGFLYATDVDAFEYELLEYVEGEASYVYPILSVVMESYWLVILLLAGSGILFSFAACPDNRTPGGFLLLTTIAYWTAVHFVFYGDGRYHFPVIPMIAAFAALYITNRLDRRKNSPAAGP